MTSAQIPDLQTLLADGGWVRDLARSLVADGNDAEDLAQEACLIALKRPPSRVDNLFGWFERVMRNLHRQGFRADSRRLRREVHAQDGKTDVAEPTDAIVERATAAKQAAEATLALAEPYRTAILMRFFDELSPREIAARTGVPISTVNTRLQRGLGKLRERFDTEPGGCRRWCLLLATPEPLATLGSLAASKFLLVPAAVLLGSGLVWCGGSVFGLRSAGDEVVAEVSAAKDGREFETSPSGDAEFEELRRLAVEAPLDELFEWAPNFLHERTARYTFDEVLWVGVDRLTREIIENPGRRVNYTIIGVLINQIEGTGRPAGPSLRDRIPLLRTRMQEERRRR